MMCVVTGGQIEQDVTVVDAAKPLHARDFNQMTVKQVIKTLQDVHLTPVPEAQVCCCTLIV